MEQDVYTTLPGVYTTLPAEEYHRLPYASNSMLGHLARSPAHMRWALENPESSPAMAFGTAVHAAILEPEKFSRYVVAGKCTATKKDGETCSYDGVVHHPDHGWRCRTKGHWQPGCVEPEYVLTASEDAAINGICHAISLNDSASKLLDSRTHTEVSCVWDDPASGARCKMRADCFSLVDGVVTIGDLKTTGNASPAEFSRSLFKFGYHRQAAFYLDGANAVGLKADAFRIIAVEKDAPYGVVVYEIDSEAIAVGQVENARLLAEFARCQSLDYWPSYPSGVQKIGVPKWASREFEWDGI